MSSSEAPEMCHVPATTFRGRLGSVAHPYESGRYWLFTAKLCPFAQRVEIVRIARGLTPHIGLTIAGSIQTPEGWDLVDRFKSAENAPSPVPGVDRLPGIYALAQPGYRGRASVPVLFDREARTIVNNESADIVHQLDAAPFADPATRPLYPQTARREIDAVTDFLESDFIAPIYRTGFAEDQQAYRRNSQQVYAALDWIDRRLADQPFLVGNEPTLADVHAFTHLARFDAVYYTLYRLNRRFLRDYRNLPAYMERLAETPGFSETLSIPTAKEGYYLSWNQPTNGAFVPDGPPVDARTGVLAAA